MFDPISSKIYKRKGVLYNLIHPQAGLLGATVHLLLRKTWYTEIAANPMNQNSWNCMGMYRFDLPLIKPLQMCNCENEICFIFMHLFRRFSFVKSEPYKDFENSRLVLNIYNFRRSVTKIFPRPSIYISINYSIVTFNTGIGHKNFNDQYTSCKPCANYSLIVYTCKFININECCFCPCENYCVGGNPPHNSRADKRLEDRYWGTWARLYTLCY